MKIEFEKEIEKEMREKLTWKAAKIAIETEFNQGKFANDEDRNKKKKTSMSDQKIKARLIKNFKTFKTKYSIFDKHIQFAVYRLKVIFFLIITGISILLTTKKTNFYVLFKLFGNRNIDFGMITTTGTSTSLLLKEIRKKIMIMQKSYLILCQGLCTVLISQLKSYVSFRIEFKFDTSKLNFMFFFCK